MAISTLVANTFSLFFFVFFNDVINLSWPRCWRLWEVNDFQAGRTELFVVSSMNLCLPALLFFILVYVLDADKTFVSKWFWRGRAQELYLSHPCERLSDNKSMQNLKWCVGYFPFLHNLENTKCLAFVVKLLDS
jgi:hypothetical protein